MSSATTTVKVGDLAPDFSVPDEQGRTVTLSALRGRPVVLFFYPKDDTPGCTKEACSFRDTFPRFEGLDAIVFGVSRDSVKSHQKFKEKFQLPYSLLVDRDREMAKAYGILGEKSMYGRTYIAALRTTFVIGRDGRIAAIFEDVKPDEHGAAVADAVAALPKR